MKKLTCVSLIIFSLLISGCTQPASKIVPEAPSMSPAPHITAESMTRHEIEIHSEEDFITLMIPHHQEAIETSKAIITSTQNEDLKKFAEGVITAQQAEVNTLTQWHEEWFGLPYETSLYQPMMSDTADLSSEEKDLSYIQDMIVHHQGAIEMAQQVLNLNPRPELASLAQNIISQQSTEISTLEAMLESVKQ